MKIGLLLISATFLCLSSFAHAQGELDSFYRPYQKNELNYRLRPYYDNDKYSTDLNSLRRNVCPDEINIGNISEDSKIFGNVDINIVIDEDVYIDCSGF